jgi:hypothetical protein
VVMANAVRNIMQKQVKKRKMGLTFGVVAIFTS